MLNALLRQADSEFPSLGLSGMRAQEPWLLYQLTANKGILASEEESNNTATAPAMVG
jgi:hypothetical protein